jgi:PAS domain S-box-containing protein
MVDINPDFRKIFESSPGAYLILSPDFQIVAVSDAYLSATMTKREEIVGRGLFEVFPDNPDDPNADGVKNLTYSLNEVLRTKKPHTMAVQKYDIPKPHDKGGGFEVRYWRPENSPILDENDKIIYITHCVEDVTRMVDVLGDAMEKQKQLDQENNR